MEPERLAAYLAGELDADERAAVEAALARDPAARAQLTRLRVADDALGRIEPATPRPGFEERLHARLRDEVDAALAPDAGDAPAAAGPEAASPHDHGAPGDAGMDGDELAARRARRRPGPAALGGAAAGLALLAVVGVALQDGPGTEDLAAPDVDEEAAEAPDGGAADTLEAADPPGPEVRATDGELTEREVARRLERPVLTELGDRGLPVDEGRRLAAAYADQLVAGPAAGSDADTPAGGSDTAAPGDGGAEDAAEAGRAPGTPSEADLSAARRCLQALLADVPEAVPAYVEIARFEGEPAILYGLVTPGPDGETYDRRELWVVDRADCQVRSFQQASAD